MDFTLTKLACGHTDSVLCCALGRSRRLVLSGGEDGLLCLTDLGCNTQVGRIGCVGDDAITSICCSPVDDHTVFASQANRLLLIDLRKEMNSNAVFASHDTNEEEINCVCVNSSGSRLAAADDSGQIQIIELPSLKIKTLRRGHTNICSSAVFMPGRPSEVITGGLDCTLVKWNIDRFRQLHRWTMSQPQRQVYNPPMIHSLDFKHFDVPVVAVARGDGLIGLYNVDSKNRNPYWLGGSLSTAINSVSFSESSFLFSGGNDGMFHVWNVQGPTDAVTSIQHNAKINCVCAAGADGIFGDVAGQVWMASSRAL